MNKIKDASFTPKHLVYLEKHYTELDKQLKEKSNELHNVVKNITYLTEIIDLFQKLEKCQKEKKVQKKKMALVSILMTILASTVIGIAGVPFSVVLCFAAGVFSIAYFTLTSLTNIESNSKQLVEKLNIFAEELNLPGSLNCDLAKTLLNQNESIQNNLSIEVNSLKQKLEYFKNLIAKIDFYLDFEYFQKKYSETVTFMQHNPYLSLLLKEVEEKEIQSSLTEETWQNFLTDAVASKTHIPETYDIPTVKLEHVKKLDLEKM